MSKPTQKNHLRKLRKNKQRNQSYILTKESERLQSLRMRAKADEEVKKVEEKEKKFLFRFVRFLKETKLWVIENTYVRILNIFRNLFKKQHANQQT